MLSRELILIVFFAIPLVWSAAIFGLRRFGPATFDDATEKRLLWLMLVPLALGGILALVARLAPLDVPLPDLALVEPQSLPIADAVAMAPATPQVDLLPWLPIAVLWIYLAITAVAAIRLLVVHVRMAQLATAARRHGGLGDEVLVTDLAIPPIAWGRKVLLPQGLVSEVPEQNLSLIVRHEREHLRRGDPVWFVILAWIDVLAWFNPLVRSQTRRYRLAASRAPASPTEKPADAVTVFPVSGRISSGFGPRIHPVTKEASFHSGVDFAIPEGTEVHSVAAGTVSFAGERDGYHEVVEIDHGGGRKTRYAQLGSVRVKAGDKVKVDHVVATSGNYGTGPHLHFEVWQDGKPIDPQTTFGDGIATHFSADNIHKGNDGTLAMSGDVRIEKGGRTLSADALTVKP